MICGSRWSQLAIGLTERRSARESAPGCIPLRPPAHHGPGVRYPDVIAALDHALPDGADIVVDAGNTGAAAIHGLPVRRGGRFLVALGMGGMGYSFGAGIGMAFGRNRRTVVIAGDGAFFMHGMEIHTAIEYRLPITFVLLNNNAHAMCVTREQLFYDGLYSYNRFSPSLLGAGLAPAGASFPSGHAAFAGATCVAAVLLFTKVDRRRGPWWALAALGIAGMAWSRTYLQVHWLLDVIAGSLLGAGVALLVFAALQLLLRAHRARESS